MNWLIIVVKIFASFFLLGLLLAGAQRASPKGRNQNIDPKIEYVVGMIGVIGGTIGLYYLWFA